MVTARTVPLAWRDVHPPRTALTGADRTRAATLLPGLEPVELRTQDGLLLRGWFAPGARTSAVVLVHGLGANRNQLLPEAALLNRHGHGVLLYDSRASGESQGRVATWGDRERADVDAALSWLSARPGVDPERLGVYGFSVGASAAALEAASDRRVRALALGPLWPSLEAELGDKFRITRARSPSLAALVFQLAGSDVPAVRPVDAVASLGARPLLLLSGTRDTDTPSEELDAVAARATQAERWRVEGAGHGGFFEIDPRGLERTLGGFFDRALLDDRRPDTGGQQIRSPRRRAWSPHPQRRPDRAGETR